MVQNKKKVSVWFVVLGAVLCAYAGYLLNGAWEPGMEMNAFLESFNRVCAEPFANYYNETTLKAVVIALIVYATALLMYITSQRNFMPGKEFGTARFESPQMANKILADKDENFNRILSQNVKMSLNFRRLKLNGNILICGGSGAGKTFYEVKPNLMQMPHNCSFICTDPKGEILRSCGEMLKNNGYSVKVINLLEMEKSDCYNPFSYIREETDVVKLITNLISNTTPKGATPSDPFWEKAEGLFLQAIFYYVWLEEPPARRNFETVLQLLGEAEVTEQNKPSRLDVRMKFLEETSKLGSAHPAVKQYNKCMRGAGDTVRSIIISANSRLAFLENKQVLRLLSRDDLDLAELGIGVNGDGETKTALFCVIPDSDKSYNFIIGMLYTQIFQELYYQADFNCGGRLPIHVTFMLDEFANVALPDDYCSLLSTMRSREISSIIIIQNFCPVKRRFSRTHGKPYPATATRLSISAAMSRVRTNMSRNCSAKVRLTRNQAERQREGREVPHAIMTCLAGNCSHPTKCGNLTIKSALSLSVVLIRLWTTSSYHSDTRHLTRPPTEKENRMTMFREAEGAGRCSYTNC